MVLVSALREESNWSTMVHEISCSAVRQVTYILDQMDQLNCVPADVLGGTL